MSVTDPFGLVGQVLDGQFRIDDMVGEGGFSAVYRGHHQGLNEPIAIKSLKLPPALSSSLVNTFFQRFRDESRILYRLSQGNLHIVRSIAAGTTQAPTTGALVPYMVLEWLEGRSLQNDFTVRRTLGHAGRSLDEIVKLFETAADGLAYAHAQGVVHRDLNPGNLFLATTQQGVKMKVLDFGVAKLMHEGALNMGPRQQTVGQIKIFAPAYGAPEQFDDRVGTVGAHSDVYSFALILLEALRDKSLNEGTHIGEFAQAACDPRRRPSPRALGIDVPDEVEAAFVRATALDPTARWQSAADFWQSLTIAIKVATERRYENAARETPPLAMGGPAGNPSPPAKAAAIGGKNLARTMPLGATMPMTPSTPVSPATTATPAMATPVASQASAMATPAMATPVASQASAMATPAMATPVASQASAMATPAVATSAMPTPATPARDTPATLARDTPATPARDTPATLARDTPATPARVTPATPARDTPATLARDTPATPALPRPGSTPPRAGAAGAGAVGAPRPRTPTAIGIPPPATSGTRPPQASGPASPVAGPPGAKRNLGSTLALSATSPLAAPAPARAAPAASALTPTAGQARTTTARPPAASHNPALPASRPLSPLGIVKGTGTDRPGALAPARFPSGATASAPSGAGNPPSQEIVELPSMDPLDDDEDEDEDETKVHAPAPGMLRTLALHDGATARAAVTEAMARARDAAAPSSGGSDAASEASMLAAAARAAPLKPPYVDMRSEVPEPPESGGTLLMLPAPQKSAQQQPHSPPQQAPAPFGATLAMPAAFAPPSPHHGSTPQAATMALGASFTQESPGRQGIAGTHGTPPQGVPAVGTAASRALPYGQGSTIVASTPKGSGNAPFSAPQPSLQPQPPAGRPSAEAAYIEPPSKGALPILPIAIALAVLALGGIGLGIFALRARQPVVLAAASVSSEVASGSAAIPVPVPVPVEPAPVPVPAVTEEVDAAPVASAVPEPTASASAASSAPAVPTTTSAPPASPPVVTTAPVPAAPVPAPSAKPPADPNAFSESAARARLGQANGVLAFCKKEGGVTGAGNASVTFAIDGTVSAVAVDPPYAGTKEGDCVASQFRRAKVTPFTGVPQTVRHSFEVPK